jgi:hypothetical protein
MFEPMPPIEVGLKFDSGKAEYDLIPAHALHELAIVLTLGAQKYSPENWRKVPEGKKRYFAALERHLWAWKRGERYDPETGRPHLAHAMCNLFFLYEIDAGLTSSPQHPIHEAK